MIQTVFSDLGNVLVRFDNGIFLRNAAAYSPLNEAEMAAAVSENLPIVRDFECGRISPGEFYRHARRILKLDIEQPAFFDIYSDIFQPRPREIRLLRELKGRCRLVLLSNTDPKRFGFIMERFPEIGFFDAAVLSYQAGWIKPDRRIFEIALRRTEAPPEACLFIDDLRENTDAARRLGMSVIHLPLEADLESELRRFRFAG
jgi:putative hydrolase of the HAD superfamily